MGLNYWNGNCEADVGADYLTLVMLREFVSYKSLSCKMANRKREDYVYETGKHINTRQKWSTD